MAELTTVQIVVMSLAVIAFSIVTGFYLWIDYKKSKDVKPRGPDIIARWIILSSLLSVVVIFLWMVGFIPKEQRWFVALFIGSIFLAVGFVYWRVFKGLKPKEMEEIYEVYALAKIKRLLNAAPYKGPASFDPIVWQQRNTTLMPDGSERIVDSFLLLVYNQINVFLVLLQLNAFTGSLIFFCPKPQQTLIYRLLGKEPAETAFSAMERFERGEETETAVKA